MAIKYVVPVFGADIACSGEVSRPTPTQQQALLPPTDMTLLSATLAPEPATLAWLAVHCSALKNIKIAKCWFPRIQSIVVTFSFVRQLVLRVSVVMDTTLGRRVAAAVRSNSNVSGGGGNSNINVSVSSGSHNPGASGSVLIGGSTTATSGVGSGSLSSSSTATGPRLRRQRSYEWRERQYSTSEDENVVTVPGATGLLHVGNTRTSNVSLQSTGGGSSSKQRASPTPAVYAAGIASLLAGYSSK
jgi:hypothetical protein